MSKTVRTIEPKGGCLQLVQITDTHLNRVPGGTLLGLDTDFSLQHVIDTVLAERGNIDLVLGTGDISDHGAEAAYGRARDYFEQLQAPVLWLAGNHDRAETMAEVLGDGGDLATSAIGGNWQVVMLNSQIPGEVGGHLGAEQLGLLEAYLAEAEQAGRYCLICLHHQPVAVGSAWIDQQMVSDSDEFLSLVERYSCARAILWGHVHQALDRQHGDIRLLSSPSSCIQFAVASDDFKVDDQAPGYRWLDLYPDGRIDTGVSRVTGVTFNVELDSSGYL